MYLSEHNILLQKDFLFSTWFTPLLKRSRWATMDINLRCLDFFRNRLLAVSIVEIQVRIGLLSEKGAFYRPIMRWKETLLQAETVTKRALYLMFSTISGDKQKKSDRKVEKRLRVEFILNPSSISPLSSCFYVFDQNSHFIMLSRTSLLISFTWDWFGLGWWLVTSTYLSSIVSRNTFGNVSSVVWPVYLSKQRGRIISKNVTST